MQPWPGSRGRSSGYGGGYYGPHNSYGGFNNLLRTQNRNSNIRGGRWSSIQDLHRGYYGSGAAAWGPGMVRGMQSDFLRMQRNRDDQPWNLDALGGRPPTYGGFF